MAYREDDLVLLAFDERHPLVTHLTTFSDTPGARTQAIAMPHKKRPEPERGPESSRILLTGDGSIPIAIRAWLFRSVGRDVTPPPEPFYNPGQGGVEVPWAREQRRLGVSNTMDDNTINTAERIKALESALVSLRERLGELTTHLGLTPGNTRLVIQRVNVMKLILQAQTEIDRLRSDPTKG